MNNYQDGVTHILDDTLNDSDKTIVSQASVGHRMAYASVTLTTTATVGARRMRLEVVDRSANVIYSVTAGATQAEGLVAHYLFSTSPGPRESFFTTSDIVVPIPAEMVLLPGWAMRFYDVNAIAVATDDMTVNVMLVNLSQVR